MIKILADFEFTKKLEKTSHTIWSIGTPYLMALEEILSKKHFFSIDIWSLGAAAISRKLSIVFRNTSVGNGFPGFRNNSEKSNELKDFIYKFNAYIAEFKTTTDQIWVQWKNKQISKIVDIFVKKAAPKATVNTVYIKYPDVPTI